MTLNKNRGRGLVQAFSGRRILVVGDLMLDRYIHGAVDRISPEAPVPVVRVSHERAVPGGSSNVALNIAALGGAATVAGIIGCDAAGEQLVALLEDGGVGTGPVNRDNHSSTTLKTRIVADRQQVVRVDWDNETDYAGELLDSFCSRLREEIRLVDGVIIEDYGKGVINQAVVDTVLQESQKAGVPTAYDPKDNHELNVAGVTLATPNRKEVFHAAGVRDAGKNVDPLTDARLLDAGNRLMASWDPSHLMMTLGAQGMLLLSKEGDPAHVPTRAREVFDVSGAGDTVIAVSLLALSAGADFHEAAELANAAAGLVVAKLGTATCTPEELLNSLGEE